MDSVTDIKSQGAVVCMDLQRSELLCNNNFINGAWVAPQSDAWYEIRNPATDLPFICVADSGAADALAATDAAAAAFPSWRARTARERSQMLQSWHAKIIANTEDLARLISTEQGKPLAEALGEVAYGASYVDWFAAEAVRSHGEILPPMIPGRRQMAVREPVGVVAAITPWNFPLAMLARKIAPALAAGCTVVAKPSEDTPLTALALARLASEAGIPAGVINTITCSRGRTPEAVSSWLRDARIRKITFTGSTSVGKYLARESSDTLKRLSLELGGNAPFIVFEDADLDAAVAGLMRGKFRNSGQTCVSPNRVFVHSVVYDEFAAKLKRAVEALRVGPASHLESEIGPLINARAVEKVGNHVRDALALGATLITGGEPVRNDVASGPFYYAPTVLGGASDAMALCHEETFGPIIPLLRFGSEAEVVARANDTSFGLAAYFYTRDATRIWRVSELLEVGVIGINEGVVASEAAPFGGIKDSGYGREGSHHGLDDYMQIKYLCQGFC